MEEKEKVKSPEEDVIEDVTFESTLRPRFLREYVGQEKIKAALKIFIEAAKARNEPLDHLLFHGPPGLGKTTLASIISQELNVNIKPTSGPAIERPGDLAAILTNLRERDVLFIDEIHRLNHVMEEILYPAMEDFKLDLVVGQGPNARIIKLDIPKFTLIGATTRAGLITSPLRDRFGVIMRIDYYLPQELEAIIHRSAKILNMQIDRDGEAEIAQRSRGTPRIANRILRRVRDFVQVKGKDRATLDLVKKALDMLDIDRNGLDYMDKKILLTIIEKFNGGPVGVETLSSAINEEKDTIEDLYEPFLIQQGYLNRTYKGRVTTRLAYDYLGIKSPT